MILINFTNDMFDFIISFNDNENPLIFSPFIVYIICDFYAITIDAFIMSSMLYVC